MSVSVRAGNRTLTNWTSISVRRSLNSLTGEFSIKAPANLMEKSPIALGEVVRIAHNGDIVLTGYAELSRTKLTSTDAETEISGRGMLADFIDGAAAPLDFDKDTSLLTIAQALAQDFVIEITDPLGVASTAKTTSPLTWKPGETGAATLARAASGSEAVLLETPEGKLTFWRSNNNAPQKKLKLKSALQLDQRVDASKLFYSYTIIGADATQDTDGVAETIVDKNVRKARRLIKAATQAGANAEQCRALADWERRHAYSQHWQADVQIASWRGDGGKILELGDGIKIADLHNFPATIVAQMALSADSKQGERAALTLALPGAYTPQPLIEPDDELATN